MISDDSYEILQKAEKILKKDVILSSKTALHELSLELRSKILCEAYSLSTDFIYFEELYKTTYNLFAHFLTICDETPISSIEKNNILNAFYSNLCDYLLNPDSVLPQICFFDWHYSILHFLKIHVNNLNEEADTFCFQHHLKNDYRRKCKCTIRLQIGLSELIFGNLISINSVSMQTLINTTLKRSEKKSNITSSPLKTDEALKEAIDNIYSLLTKWEHDLFDINDFNGD